MTKTLADISQELKDHKEKIQLIYAFNGSGKTRLSRAFRDLVFPKNEDDPEYAYYPTLLYYNAFTEDLFSWDNDLFSKTGPKLKILPNYFTDWILKTEGEDLNIINKFQDYTNNALTPQFNEDFTEVTFSYQRGNDEDPRNVKISKGEESCFIWSIFYIFFQEAIRTLRTAEISERNTDRYNNLKYIFIDDPVSSLDENHLIKLALDIVELISSDKDGINFIITTHNPLFYNVIYSNIKNKKIKSGYILCSHEDGTYSLKEKYGEANTAFAYHLYIKKLIKDAVDQQQVQRYHFMLLRNLYEKTAGFLGYENWREILPENNTSYAREIMNFYSHNKLSYEEGPELTQQHKAMISHLLEHLNNFGYAHKEMEK